MSVLSLNLVTVLIGIYLSASVRTDADLLNVEVAQEPPQPCRHAAKESNAEDFDFESLIFDEPDFSFFASREFFLSDRISCERPLEDLTLERIPTSSDQKRAFAEQRFIVKNARDALHTVSRQDSTYIKNLKERLGAEVERGPAVELHMFPRNLQNVTAPHWQVLLVPKCPEVFGRDLYLCQSATRRQDESKCVASLPFKKLPLRLRSLVWSWDPVLDTRRSAPHLFILSVEVLLVVVLLALVTKTVLCVHTLCRAPGEPEDGNIERDKILTAELPTTYQLSQHGCLHDSPGGIVSENILEAGIEVTIHEMELVETFQMSQPQELWRWICGKPSVGSVWGKLQNATDVKDAWILLFEETSRVKPPGVQKATYIAHEKLLLPLSDMFQGTLLLSASYMSMLWLIASQLSDFDTVSIALLVLSSCTLHLLVLYFRMFWYHSALQHEEMLDQRQLLRLSEHHNSWVFKILLAVIILIVAKNLPRISLSEVAPVASVLLNLGIHAYSWQNATVAVHFWRQPRVQSSEFMAVLGEQLPITSEKPPLRRSRALKFIALDYGTTVFAAIALVVLMALCLDWLQLRGEVVHMEWTRGHMVYPWSSRSWHNTLLLDMNADSLTVDVDVLAESVACTVEHATIPPQHFPPQENQSSHFAISVPRLPFYSRVSFLVKGVHRSTTYVVHIIRLGEAMNLSLSGSFEDGEPFHERRRLLYQMQHSSWYIPDISSTNSSLQLHILPVSFAPMMPVTSFPADVPRVMEDCNCGNVTSGFGSNCDFELGLPEQQLCISVVEATHQLGDLSKPAGVAGISSALSGWLQNTSISGKRVGLRAGQDVMWFNATAGNGVESTFELVTRSENVSFPGNEIMLSSTQDSTDSEVEVVPFDVVFHAPPPMLSTECSNSTACFLLPPFDAHDFRTEYMLCGGQADVQAVDVRVADTRFEVVQDRISSRPGCRGEDVRVEFHVRRKGCSGSCGRYAPRGEGFDLAVVQSTGHCLRMAVELDKDFALARIAGQQGGEECMDKFGLLGEAIHRNQSNMVKEMLSHGASWQATASGATPMQIAASDGNIDILKILMEIGKADVNQEKDERTCLSYASQQCHVETVKFLLEKGAKADLECSSNPLWWMLTGENSGCHGESLNLTAELLKNDAWGAMDDDCRGEALREAVQNRNFPLAEIALNLGADPKPSMEKLAADAYRRLRRASPHSDSIRAFITQAAQFLVTRGNADMTKLLEKASSLCDVQLFSTLLKFDAQKRSDIFQKKCKKKESLDAFQKLLNESVKL